MIRVIHLSDLHLRADAIPDLEQFIIKALKKRFISFSSEQSN